MITILSVLVMFFGCNHIYNNLVDKRDYVIGMGLFFIGLLMELTLG